MNRKILLVTDAWHPQINGVVTTLSNLVKQAKLNGDKIHVYHPGRCKIRFPLPFYPEIKVGLANPFHVRKLLKKQKWDHIHIATPEGSLGITFARTCRRLNIPFSTSCHTKFPEFINARFPFISVDIGWKWMKHVYRDSTHILTTTETMKKELTNHGFKQKIYSWSRGVDRTIFKPNADNTSSKIKTLLYVGRISHEKNIEDFCKLDIQNTTKIAVGDGPQLKELKKRYPDVLFVGYKHGKELAKYYASADVFVFPSKSDTFGVVILEAMACGTPTAAYPVTGPIDIIRNGVNGYIRDNLYDSVKHCLTIDRKRVIMESEKWSWETCYQQFTKILLPIEEKQLTFFDNWGINST